MDFEDESEILRTAYSIISFEEEILRLEANGKVEIPVYLGLGQEFIASTFARFFRNQPPGIFAQHRSHSYYLAFGGDRDALLAEILGDEINGCAKGYGGSVGIYSKKANMFGHTGLMGEQAYLGVGWALANNKRTLIVIGDATVEEDYVSPALGFAATHSLPCIFICEDNGLAVLTPTVKRRSWKATDLAQSFGIKSFSISDSPDEIVNVLSEANLDSPLFLNINTNRKSRHVGALLEGTVTVDRLKIFENSFVKKYGKEQLEAIQSR